MVAVFGTAWAGTSANYRITTEVLDGGAVSGQSGSYRLLGKTRDRELQVPGSTNFRIGEGFLRSIYFPRVIFAPIVTAINPKAAVNTGPVSASISGANFVAGASAKLSLSGGPEIVASKVVVVSASRITCDFDITGVKSGLWSVIVTNPDGRFGTLPSALKITYPMPVVSSVTPDRGVNNEIVIITNLAGKNFMAGASVKLSKAGESDIMGEKVVVESAEKITCLFNLMKKAVGLWDLSISNEDGQSGTLSQVFKIEAPVLEMLEPVKNSPNPFNPVKEPTVISYTLSKDSDITIDIFNVRGERVWQYRASAGTMGGMAGFNVVGWNGVTAFKSFANEGIYFLYVSAKISGQVKVLSRTKVAVIK